MAKTFKATGALVKITRKKKYFISYISMQGLKFTFQKANLLSHSVQTEEIRLITKVNLGL